MTTAPRPAAQSIFSRNGSIAASFQDEKMLPRVIIGLALCLWLLLAVPALAQDPPALALRDERLGYIVPLPQGWSEVTDQSRVEHYVRKVCAFLAGGKNAPDMPVLAGASGIRAAALPEDTAASPALVVFLLDYAALGLNAETVRELAENSEAVAANLANALQHAYLDVFPRSIMVNSYLGEDFFSLNLRSLPEGGAARNQHFKLILTSAGALILMTLYEGPEDAAYDSAIAASVRETIIMPEHALHQVKPPYKASFADYLLVGAALLATVVILRKAFVK